MIENTHTTHCENTKWNTCTTHPCFSWSAIIVGALAATGFSFLLNLFALAIGLITFDNTSQGIASVVIGGFIGMLIGVIVIMFVAGWITGRIASIHCSHKCLGALYGFATWCLALIFTIVLAAPATAYLSSYYHSLTGENTVITGASHRIRTSLTEQAAAPISDAKSNQTLQSNQTTEKKANDAGVTIFLTFLLFFIGALAASIGGVCGIKPKKCTITTTETINRNVPPAL